MIPGHRADEVLDDLALDLDERRDVLGVLAGQVGQQSLEVEAAIPGERQNPVTTALSRLPFRKHQCENTPLTGTI